MTKEQYQSFSLISLREMAKARGMTKISALRKEQLIEAMLRKDQADAEKSQTPVQEKKTEGQADSGPEGAVYAKRPEKEPDRAPETSREEQHPAGENRNRAVRANRQDSQREGSGAESGERASGGRTFTRRTQQRNQRRSLSSGRNENVRNDYSRNENSRNENARGDYSRNENSRNENARSDYNRNEDGRSENNRSESSRGSGSAAPGPSSGETGASDRPPMELSSLDSGNRVTGVLEVLSDGYGFIRSDNYLPGDHDVYVAPSQIRKFSLKTGDIIAGNTRIRAQQEKFSALLYVNTVNGMPPSQAAQRRNFEDMTPIFPNYRLKMEREGGDVSMRIVDLISPIGRGQRGMIVSQPKAGKTTLLKQLAHSILVNDPYMHLMIMLIDERPEEVTDIREDIVGERVEVLYSTFDEEPEHHIRVARMGIERAKRLVEYGEHVTILLDSITRLARAANLTEQPSGRTLSGGLDPAALNMPKRFFGAARNMREGGSLTILATALIDTGSKMDDVVYEEFKGTGNMELVLDRRLSERRVFPAIDINASSTRREDLLLSQEEQEAVFYMRRALSSMKTEEAAENILSMFLHTRNNAELVARIRRQKYV